MRHSGKKEKVKWRIDRRDSIQVANGESERRRQKTQV